MAVYPLPLISHGNKGDICLGQPQIGDLYNSEKRIHTHVFFVKSFM